MKNNKWNLEEKYPYLSKEWHMTFNKLSPKEVTPYSNKKVWWICNKKHIWKTSINNRTSNKNNCPYCSNQRVCSENCLANNNQLVSNQWHPTKNKDITPFDYTCGSSKKVWWICKNNHEWEARIADRTRGRGCPYCSNKKVNIDNCLASINPELSKQWHPTKNNNLKPSEVVPNSGKTVWWTCSKNHEWKATIVSRHKGRGCPYCTNSKVCIDNCLKTVSPYLASQWHPTLNNPLTPTQLTARSNKKVWWICTEGHHWEATVNSRFAGNNCPICNEGSQTSFPEKAIYYYCKKISNNVLSQTKVLKYSIDILIFNNIIIEYDGYYYHKNSIENDENKNRVFLKNGYFIIRVREDGLPKLPNHKNYKCFSIQDGNRYQLNEIITDILIFLVSKHNLKPFNFTVDVCRDELEIINLYTQKKINKSLASLFPEISKEWNYNLNGKLKPNNVSPFSSKKVWWTCKNRHEWKTSISNRTYGNSCPYCSNKKVNKDNCLATINPKLAIEWHPTKNNDLQPTDVVPGSSKKVWWICCNGHEFQMVIRNRKKAGFCPYCHGRETPIENSLFIINPKLAKEWNYYKNIELTPSQVKQYSNKRVWWICEFGHEWQSTVGNRSRNNSGCPICKTI